ncbi:MAG: hypothetical protein ACREE4_01000 [Stellaceae bacterium]
MPQDAPVITVHSLAQAVAALKAAAGTGVAITLASAPEAGISAGPGWWRALVEMARKAVPAAEFSTLLDCGAEPGAALAAIRAQVEAIVFTGRADVAGRLADVARQHGVRLVTTQPTPILDLGAAFFAASEHIERRCLQLLAQPGFRRAPAAAGETGSGGTPACRSAED